MRENEKLITIARFENAVDAQLAKMVLEREGIESFIVGQNLEASIYFAVAAHIELQVFSGDAARAAELLAKPVENIDMDEDINE